MADSALSDIKVLEFGNLVTAPYCTKLLAELGAEVIKIEAPGLGDESRRRAPFAKDRPGLERSGLFSYLNTSKLGITLNPGTAAGRKLFRELIKQADILVENNAPSQMEKLGLTYRDLEAINPKLLMTSITPYGQTGPYRDYKAQELTMYHGSGYGIQTTVRYGGAMRPPAKAAGRQSQLSAAQVAAVATLFALISRDQSGVGQHADISIQEVMTGHYEAYIEYWTFMATETGASMIPRVAPVSALRCRDGWVFLMCIEEHQYNNLLNVMGNPDWAKDERFKDRFTRAANLDALIPLIAEWSMQHTKEEVFRLAQDAHVPLAPAYNVEEVVNSSQIQANHFFVEIDHPVIGPGQYPGAPYRLSETPWRIQRRAPLLGEHNEEIYCGRLGYTKQDLVKLAQAGVI